jgi:hypothetical protein
MFGMTRPREPVMLHRRGSRAVAPDDFRASQEHYPLSDLLFCGICDEPFFATCLPDGSRAYRSRCGCRLHPVDASELERRVHAEAQRRVFGTASALTDDQAVTLTARLFARITLGTTPDDLRFIPRI